MKSAIVKRSVVIGRHKTSISLEEPFWTALKQIAHAQQVTLSALVSHIDGTRDEQSNLSSGIRVFVLRHSRLAPVAEWPSSPDTGSWRTQPALARRARRDPSDITTARVIDGRRAAKG